MGSDADVLFGREVGLSKEAGGSAIIGGMETGSGVFASAALRVC